jgi:hypothetical protein
VEILVMRMKNGMVHVENTNRVYAETWESMLSGVMDRLTLRHSGEGMLLFETIGIWLE